MRRTIWTIIALVAGAALVEAAPLLSVEEGDAHGSVAVSIYGNATCEPMLLYPRSSCIAASVFGDSQSGCSDDRCAAISAFGDATAKPYGIGASGTGNASGHHAISATGSASGSGKYVDCIAVSGTADASASCPSISGKRILESPGTPPLLKAGPWGAWLTRSISEKNVRNYDFYIDIDSKNQSHIIYADWDHNVLYLAPNGTKAILAEGGLPFRLQIDEDDVLHVGYRKSRGSSLGIYYAFNSNGTWVHERVYDTGTRIWLASMDVRNSHVSIAHWTYLLNHTEVTYYAERLPNGSWKNEDVAYHHAGEYDGNWLALDRNGNPYLVLDNRTQLGRIDLFYKKDGAWQNERVDTCEYYQMIAMGPSDGVHIACRVWPNRVVHVERTAHGWRTELAGGIYPYREFQTPRDLVVDAAGRPHIVASAWSRYCLPGLEGTLLYMTKTVTGWVTEEPYRAMRSEGCNGNLFYGEIALDGGGAPHVLYFVHRDALHSEYGLEISSAVASVAPAALRSG